MPDDHATAKILAATAAHKAHLVIERTQLAVVLTALVACTLKL